MREVPKFSEGGEIVVALEDRDLIALEDTFAKARDLWVQEWIKQGSTDEGSACLGKGLEVWHVRKGARVARPRMVVPCPPVQGNLSAAFSKEPAIDFLLNEGIEVRYNDGVMD